MEIKHQQGRLLKEAKKLVYEPFFKRELERIIDQEYWTNNIHDKIIWSPFHGILEHKYHNSKVLKNLIYSFVGIYRPY